MKKNHASEIKSIIDLNWIIKARLEGLYTVIERFVAAVELFKIALRAIGFT